MIVDVTQESQPDLEAYARVPIAFEVRETMRVVSLRDASSRRRFTLEPQPVNTPWIKDYDVGDGGPRTWPARFDLSRWTFFVARVAGERVGGAVVVYQALDVEMLGGRTDLALLWDIRVAPSARGRGVGAALIGAAEAWAAKHGARWMEIETQDINAPACRFYAAHGYELASVDPHAYPDLPAETQLLWSKQLRKLGSDP